MGNLKRFGEFGLIDRFRTRLTARSSQVKVGIGDDCAVYRPRPGYLEIASSDALIEKVHFDLHQPITLTGFTASAFHIEAEAARPIPTGSCLLGTGEQLSNGCKEVRISRRI